MKYVLRSIKIKLDDTKKAFWTVSDGTFLKTKYFTNKKKAMRAFKFRTLLAKIFCKYYRVVLIDDSWHIDVATNY
jgi:hypothetical protein